MTLVFGTPEPLASMTRPEIRTLASWPKMLERIANPKIAAVRAGNILRLSYNEALGHLAPDTKGAACGLQATLTRSRQETRRGGPFSPPLSAIPSFQLTPLAHRL